MISTANLEVLGHAAMLSFVFLLIYAFLTLCYFVIRGAEIPLWFWPGSHGNIVSLWSVGIPAAAVIVLAILIATLENGDQLLVATFCLPLLVLAGVFIAYLFTHHRTPRAGRSADVRPSQIWANVASFCFAWIALAIVPAGVFFKVAGWWKRISFSASDIGILNLLGIGLG